MENSFFEPMKPIHYPRIFNDERFRFQVKWDGVRMLAYVDGGKVVLSNINAKDKTIQFPELSAMSGILKVKQAVLDGELVVLKDGKPHFPSILRRNLCQSSGQAHVLSRELPAVYMVFDLLQVNGRDLRREPLELRCSRLQDCLFWQAPLHLVESFADGPGLFKAVKENGLEGVVAKRKSSVYTAGKNHNDWLKIKYRRRQVFVIGGFTCNQGRVNSLLTGFYDPQPGKDNLFYVGKVGSGLKETEWDLLTDMLPKMKIDHSPFFNLKSSQIKQAIFIEPVLTAEIEFAEMTDSLRLRAPVIKGFSSLTTQK